MANKYGGGSKTNEVGLKFEQETSLSDALALASKNGVELSPDGFVLKFKKKIGYLASKNALYKKFLDGIALEGVISKKLLPDDAFVNIEQKILYIIEKKFQHRAGSVDEKLQTCDFKLKQYTKLANLKGYSVIYVYVLNEWFKQEQYKDVLEYIRSVGCDYFFSGLPIEYLGINI